MQSRSLPARECFEQPVAHCWWHVLLADATDRLDRDPQLADVRLAARAVVQVLLEELHPIRRQLALEIVVDELDYLLAGDVVGGLSHRGAFRARPARASAHGGAVSVG